MPFSSNTDVYKRQGLVHVSMLPGDYYYYDEAACEMRGTRTGKAYKLGEKLKVKVKFADRFTRTIDFVLPHEEEGIDDGEGSTETGCQ